MKDVSMTIRSVTAKELAQLLVEGKITWGVIESYNNEELCLSVGRAKADIVCSQGGRIEETRKSGKFYLISPDGTKVVLTSATLNASSDFVFNYDEFIG